VIAALVTDWKQTQWVAVALLGGLAPLCVPVFFLPREEEHPAENRNKIPSYDGNCASYDGKKIVRDNAH
jgi:hypothetical protein